MNQNPNLAATHAHESRLELERGQAERFADLSVRAVDRIENSRIAASTLHATFASPSGKPLLQSDELVAEIESPERRVAAWVENFYATTGRRFLPIHLLFGADGDGTGAIRRIAYRAVAAYDQYFSNGDGITHDGNRQWVPSSERVPIAVVTSRPNHRWPVREDDSFESVADRIKADVHCDFDLGTAPTELGSCVERLGHVADLFGRSGPAERQKYICEHFSTVVFGHGDLAIFARVCEGCWQSFLYRNNIDAGTCEITQPWTDGFRSVS